MTNSHYSFVAPALLCFTLAAGSAMAQQQPAQDAALANVAAEVPSQAAPSVPGQELAVPQSDAIILVPLGDLDVARKLEDLIATRLAEVIPRKPEQEAVEAFYRARGFQPLWTSNGAATARALAASDYLKNVANEGLDPRDYPVPVFSGLSNLDAKNELKLTRSVLDYARHASSGRVSFTRVSGSILYPPHALAPAQVLSQIANSDDVASTLGSFEPQHPGFKALQAALAAELDAPQSDNARASSRHGRIDRIDLIVANMERWRWLPRNLGTNYVMVDVPAFSLSVFSKGSKIWQTKIVVGQSNKSTPLLSETMKYLTVNPTWNVPPSIIRNEYLPALQRDPDALERIGLKVARNHDGSLRVYQPPGERNALGRIRFNFPNVFLVYQHDTPQKNFFARDNRALSHGCMRVQYPEKYAELLLSLSQPEDGFTVHRIASMYGNDERTINLKRPIPVHITYQTAYVDDAGHLKTRADIYGLDAALLRVMRGDERGIADTPIARNYQASSKPVMARLPERSAGEARISAYANADDRWDRDGQWGRDNRNWDLGWRNRDYGEPRGFSRPYDRAVGQW